MQHMLWCIFICHTHPCFLFESVSVQHYPKTMNNWYGTPLLQPAGWAGRDRCGKIYLSTEVASERAKESITHSAHVHGTVCCRNGCTVAGMAITANTQPLKQSGTATLLLVAPFPMLLVRKGALHLIYHKKEDTIWANNNALCGL